MENHPQQGDRLSWGDTVFLNLEREGMPLNVASVCIFEGQVSFAEFLRFVESKLPLIPRYFKRVVAPPFSLGLPSWEWDPNFDIHNHVREVKLKNGTEAELRALAGKILSKVMDRQRPLWDLTLVQGLKGNRTGLIARLHHCLADGIAGVGIMKVLLDASPTAPPLSKKRFKFEMPRPLDPLTSLMNGVVESYSDLVKGTLSALADMLTMVERAAANGQRFPADELSRYLPEITAFTERLRFNVPYRGPQQFAWAEIPLEEVKGIRHACGTSVNDVVLALMTATIRRYSEMHGDRVKGRLLRMMVPVNLRGTVNSSELGNRISLVPITIPLDIRNPKKLLAAAHERTEFIKRAHAAELVSLAGGMIGMFPTSLQALVGPLLSRLPITPFNLVCTNVPGPQFALYLRGHKLQRWYPYVPIGGEMAVNCAILSYNGTMYFGFSGDVHAAPDLQRFEALLKTSFSELQEATGTGTPKRKKQVKPRAKSRAKKKPTIAAAPVPETTSAPSLPADSIEPTGKLQPATDVEQKLTQLIA